MSLDPLELAKKKTQLQETLKKAESAKDVLETAGKITSLDWKRNDNVSNLAKEQLQNLNVGGISAADVTAKLDKLKELPIQPDPELIKKEAMARAQTLRADAEQMLQQRKEEEINKLKEKAEKIIPPKLISAAGLFLVLPTKDPKFLAWLAYQKAKTKITELKQKASKENLKKSKEAFTFPMKPPIKLEAGELPKIEAPKIPNIPKITTPKLPTVPPQGTYIKAPTPQSLPPKSTVPAGISETDWRRFGVPADRDTFGDTQVVKDALQRKQIRRQEIIRMQEERVRKAKEFVDRQAQRLETNPSLQSSYDTGVRVYNQRVAYLQKVKSDTSIVDLTE